MKIAFVFAPYSHKSFSENLKVVDDDFGVFPPVNLAWAAAIAEQAGHDVRIVDANAEGLTIEQTLTRLREFGPRVVGFYFSTYMFHDTLAWAREIKAALGVSVLAGGINLMLYPEETMTHPEIDFGVSGQASQALPLLLDAIEAGGDPEGIQGVCYRRQGEVVISPPDGKLRAFAALPFPARHLLPNDRYYSITSQLRNFTVILTAVGCKQHCSFCPIARIPYQSRPVDIVLKEMQECVDRYGIREIDIFDADFPCKRKRVEAICRGIVERRLRFEWSCRACVDSLDGDLLRLMAEAGCKKVYLGIETRNENSLHLMNKKIFVPRVRRVIREAQHVGIHPLGFFMTGVPGETRLSLVGTLRYALSLGLDYAQFSRTIAKPGTDLDDEVVSLSGRDYWKDYVLGDVEEQRLPNPWTSIGEREIEFWTKCAYCLFYFRPTYMAKAIRRFRSPEELNRSLRTSLRMLGHLFTSDK